MKMPAVFVSHGAPTLAIESHEPTHAFLLSLGKALPEKPRAILCVSAHWEARQPTLSAAPEPATIHDFYGFPEALYRIRYEAPGDPVLAARVRGLVAAAGIEAALDEHRGLDHGAWVPLSLAYPAADVPVLQLSVQSSLGASHHVALGRALAPLREEGILILGSGGATHDLRRASLGGRPDPPVPPDVRAFEEWLVSGVEAGATADLVAWQERAPYARENHPTAEHFLPLFVPLGGRARGNEGPRPPPHVRLRGAVDGRLRLGLKPATENPFPVAT
jgi:4,5-DOPA dioxygenase extradiol